MDIRSLSLGLLSYEPMQCSIIAGTSSAADTGCAPLPPYSPCLLKEFRISSTSMSGFPLNGDEVAVITQSLVLLVSEGLDCTCNIIYLLR